MVGVYIVCAYSLLEYEAYVRKHCIKLVIYFFFISNPYNKLFFTDHTVLPSAAFSQFQPHFKLLK